MIEMRDQVTALILREELILIESEMVYELW